MKKPLVHVLVINWNGIEHLRECFDTLLANTYPYARYVFLDNASTDGSAAFVKEQYGHDSRVEVLEFEKNLGWAGCNNVGITRALQAGADYIFLLNNDTASAPDVVERLVAAAEARPDAGALAPKMLLYHTPWLINSIGIECSIIGSGWDRGLGRADGPRWNIPGPVIGVCGGACLLRASALQKTGLLPEDYEIYLDDLELGLRMWAAGYGVWTCPEAVVHHKFSATMGQGARARRKYYLNVRNRLRLITRNFPATHFPSVAKALLAGECRAMGRSLLDGCFWRVGAHVKAWLAAMAYIPRALNARRDCQHRGLEPERFWPMVRQDTLFFAGYEAPQDGWFPPIERDGLMLRPISSYAKYHAKGGCLRITGVNCYPHLHPLDIEVRANGIILARLCTLERTDARFEAPAGELEIVAHSVFDADETGEQADYGGWLVIEPLD